MWMYLGQRCDDMKINTRIQGVLAHGADQFFGSDRDPLREGVVIPWVNLLKLTFVFLC
jgi:hypothetical protein